MRPSPIIKVLCAMLPMLAIVSAADAALPKETRDKITEIRKELGGVSKLLRDDKLDDVARILKAAEEALGAIEQTAGPDNANDRTLLGAKKYLLDQKARFLKAKGIEVGKSLVEDDLIDTAKNVMEKAEEKGVKIILPADCVVAEKADESAQHKKADIHDIPAGWMGLDIGDKTLALFKEALEDAKTIVWNGPMGVFEMEPFSKGTYGMVDLVTGSPALSIVGGGDTDVALHRSGKSDSISFISTAGGAFLELLKGSTLPGIAALNR